MNENMLSGNEIFMVFLMSKNSSDRPDKHPAEILVNIYNIMAYSIFDADLVRACPDVATGHASHTGRTLCERF